MLVLAPKTLAFRLFFLVSLQLMFLASLAGFSRDTIPCALDFVPVKIACGNDPAGGAVLIKMEGGCDWEIEWNRQGESPKKWRKPSDTEGLKAGIYEFSAKGEDGNLVQRTIELVAPPSLSYEFKAVAPSCASSKDGRLTLIVKGGISDYQYSWSHDTTASGFDQLGLPAGSYTVTVTDAVGCVLKTEPFEFEDLLDLELNVTTTPTLCNQLQSGSATAEARVLLQKRIKPSYSWSNGATLPAITDLAAGVYSVTVSAGQCKKVETVEVLPTLRIDSVTVEAVTCFGGADGQARVHVKSNSGQCTASWSGGITTGPFEVEGLRAGEHQVTVTEGAGCQEEATFKIASPDKMAVYVDPSKSKPACGTEANGAISLLVNGGTAPFLTDWRNGNPMEGLSRKDLKAGKYLNVLVTDNNGCQEFVSFEVLEAPRPDFTLLVTDTLLFKLGDTLKTTAQAIAMTPSNANLKWRLEPAESGRIASPKAPETEVLLFDATILRATLSTDACTTHQEQAIKVVDGPVYVAEVLIAKDGQLQTQAFMPLLAPGIGTLKSVVVYSPYGGAPVFSSEEAGLNAWDGKEYGKEYHKGSRRQYPYEIRYTLSESGEEAVKRGTVTVLIEG